MFNSLPTGIVPRFCCRLLTIFFQEINFFQNFFQEHYQSAKLFGFRSEPMLSAGDTSIGKELMFTFHFVSLYIS